MTGLSCAALATTTNAYCLRVVADGMRVSTTLCSLQCLNVHAVFIPIRAFLPLQTDPLQFLVPAKSGQNCTTLGLGQYVSSVNEDGDNMRKTNNSLPFLNFTALYIENRYPNNPSLWLNLSRIVNFARNQSTAGNFFMPTQCMDVFIPNNDSVSNINRAMYCGYTQVGVTMHSADLCWLVSFRLLLLC